MLAGRVDLPDIWRGLDWPAVTLIWKDSNGDPFNLTGYIPFAQTSRFDLRPVVLDPPNGVTTISLPRAITASLPIGVFNWDWLWKNVPDDFVFPRYFLFGEVEVRDALSNPVINV